MRSEAQLRNEPNNSFVFSPLVEETGFRLLRFSWAAATPVVLSGAEDLRMKSFHIQTFHPASR
jgi:hypothetical protein